MIDLIGDLVPLLGSRKDEATLRRIKRFCRGRRRTDRHGPITYWSYHGAGISFHFSGPRLSVIFLGPVDHGDHPFQGLLAKGLTFQARRKEVHAVLGIPVRSSPGGLEYCDECAEGTHLIAVRPTRDSYDYPAYTLLFEFDGEKKRDANDPLKISPPKECPPGDLPITLVAVSHKESAPTIKTTPALRVSVTDTEITATFLCAQCLEAAETIKLTVEKTGPPLAVAPDKARLLSTHADASEVGPNLLPAVMGALKQGDCAALYKLNQYWAALFCPECQASYCKAHWFREEGPPSWGSSYSWDYVEYGTCPEGHKRILRKL